MSGFGGEKVKPKAQLGQLVSVKYTTFETSVLVSVFLVFSICISVAGSVTAAVDWDQNRNSGFGVVQFQVQCKT